MSIHPVWHRCSSLKYYQYARFSRLARRVSKHPSVQVIFASLLIPAEWMFLRFRQSLSMIILIALFSLLLVPSIHATEGNKQNPHILQEQFQNTLERNQKIHTLSQAIQNIVTSLEDAPKLEESKQSIF